MDAFCARTRYPYSKDNRFYFCDDFAVPVQSSLFFHTDELLEARLREMDDCGVATQVLGHSPGLEEFDVPVSIECARATNDFIHETAKKHPDRFICFGTFPVGDIAAALDEMKRCKFELGFRGWMTFSNYKHSYIDDPKYYPLLEKAEEYRFPIYIHPTNSPIDRLAGLGSTLAAGAMGFTIDAAITIMRMVWGGVFDRFPKLQVILGHLGEGLPYSLDRIDKRSSTQKTDKSSNKHLPSYYFKENIWVTTSGIFSIPTFECAKAVLGIDRILYGSDYPYEKLPDAVGYVKSLSLTVEEREKLYFKNADRLFSM